MRVVFTSDFHGRLALFDQLAGLLRVERPGLLILGGDMHPDGGESDPVGDQQAFVHRELIPRLREWRAAIAGLSVACILGNHDWLPTQQTLRELQADGDLVLLTPERPWRHAGIHFTGFSHTPPTPFCVKDFERLDAPGDSVDAGECWGWNLESARAQRLDARAHLSGQLTLAEQLALAPHVDSPWIFVCHAPPYGTRLDRLPGVDHPVGSKAVREFIETRKPMLALHGHIHESPGLTGAYCERVGETLCVNPGQAAEVLHAVAFDSGNPPGTLRHTVYP